MLLWVGYITLQTYLVKKCVFIDMNIKRIILEEIDNFEWMDEIEADALHVGSFVYIDGTSDVQDGFSGNWQPGQYIVLEIISIDEDGDVRYKTRHSNLEEEAHNIGQIDYTEYSNARRLVDIHYWKPWDGKQGLDLKESNDFEWAKDYSDAVDDEELKAGNIYEVGDDRDFYNTIIDISNGIVYYTILAYGELTYHDMDLYVVNHMIESGWWSKVEYIPAYMELTVEEELRKRL